MAAAAVAALALPLAASPAPAAGPASDVDVQAGTWAHRDVTDFTDSAGAPPPIGRGLSALRFRSSVFYQGANNHIQHVEHVIESEEVTDITTSAGAPVPSSTVRLLALQQNEKSVYYVDNGHVMELRWDLGLNRWVHADLTELTDAPLATGVGNLVGFVNSKTDPQDQDLLITVPRIYYVRNGQVHELGWYPEQNRWLHLNLSAVTGAPPADDRAFTAFLNSFTPRVYYASSDGHVHELRWNGAWRHFDITGNIGAPLASHVHTLTGFSWHQNDTPRVYYLGRDNKHVYELRVNSAATWVAADVVEISGAPERSYLRLVGCYLGERSRVYAMDLEGRVTQFFMRNGTWAHVDVTAAAGAPRAALGALTAFDVDGAPFHGRVYYFDDANRLHELAYTE